MRRLIGYILAFTSLIVSEIAHQLIHMAEWCLDAQDITCPTCASGEIYD